MGLRERKATHFGAPLGSARVHVRELPDNRAGAVIGGARADDPAPARGRPRHAQRHLVRLGPGAQEHDALQTLPVKLRDPFGELEDALVQMPAVHVEGRLLGRHRLHY